MILVKINYFLNLAKILHKVYYVIKLHSNDVCYRSLFDLSRNLYQNYFNTLNTHKLLSLYIHLKYLLYDHVFSYAFHEYI